MNSAVKAYYKLIKPGVTYGNVLTVIAGYLLASGSNIEWVELISVTIGMTLIIASACSLNNYLDQDIDVLMERTKKRPSVQGTLSASAMKLFSGILLLLGVGVLLLTTNLLTAGVAMSGFVVYVWLYGASSKRRSVHGTMVGSVSGAMPILAGYVASAGSIDVGGLLAFMAIFFWQFPEFYSIAIYRRKEYAAARIPVISVVKGVDVTIRYILFYTALYVFTTLALSLAGYAGSVFFVVMAAVGAWWIKLAYEGLSTPAHLHDAWARRMFRFSMITIVLLCFMLSVGSLLP